MHTEERFSSAICLDSMKICCCKEAYAKLINFMDAPCDKKCDIPAVGPQCIMYVWLPHWNKLK